MAIAGMVVSDSRETVENHIHQALGTPCESIIRAVGITQDDWQLYRDFYKRLSTPHHFRGVLAGQDFDAPETYKQFLPDSTTSPPNFIMFGMFDGDKMIGQSSIDLSEKDGRKIALLAGSEIANEYRGQRLVDIFYTARMQSLYDMLYDGTIETSIRPENLNSIKAALRNGFKNTGLHDGHGYCIFRPDERRWPAIDSTPTEVPSLPRPRSILRSLIPSS